MFLAIINHFEQSLRQQMENNEPETVEVKQEEIVTAPESFSLEEVEQPLSLVDKANEIFLASEKLINDSPDLLKFHQDAKKFLNAIYKSVAKTQKYNENTADLELELLDIVKTTTVKSKDVKLEVSIESAAEVENEIVEKQAILIQIRAREDTLKDSIKTKKKVSLLVST